MPFLAVDYAFYYIDKTTLSYAALFGLKDDLNLEGEDYSNLSSIFYIGWLVWAIPGNLLLAKFPLAKYLAFNVSNKIFHLHRLLTTAPHQTLTLSDITETSPRYFYGAFSWPLRREAHRIETWWP